MSVTVDSTCVLRQLFDALKFIQKETMPIFSLTINNHYEKSDL